MSEFFVGDVVRLMVNGAGNGPGEKMTVEGIEVKPECTLIHTVWFDYKNQLQRSAFDVKLLEKAE